MIADAAQKLYDEKTFKFLSAERLKEEFVKAGLKDGDEFTIPNWGGKFTKLALTNDFPSLNNGSYCVNNNRLYCFDDNLPVHPC